MLPEAQRWEMGRQLEVFLASSSSGGAICCGKNFVMLVGEVFASEDGTMVSLAPTLAVIQQRRGGSNDHALPKTKR